MNPAFKRAGKGFPRTPAGFGGTRKRVRAGRENAAGKDAGFPLMSAAGMMIWEVLR